LAVHHFHEEELEREAKEKDLGMLSVVVRSEQ
jgi:hypothetical protein